MPLPLTRLLALLIATGVLSAQDAGKGLLFSESFEDADLLKRGWYDSTTFRIVGDASAGKGCIEYEWTSPDETVSGSASVRRLFEPTDEVFLR